MVRRKRRQLKNRSGGNKLSSDMVFVVIPLIVATIICCFLVFGTFRRIQQDAAMMSIRDNMIQMEMASESLDEQQEVFL